MPLNQECVKGHWVIPREVPDQSKSRMCMSISGVIEGHSRDLQLNNAHSSGLHQHHMEGTVSTPVGKAGGRATDIQHILIP